MPKKPSDVCIGCGKPKSPETFGSYIERRGRDAGKRKLWGRCYECMATYHREYNARNPDKRKRQAAAGYRRAKAANPDLNWERDLRRTYGLSAADYWLMSEAQAGVCAACQQPSEQRLQVDHCHRSGQVRALLCGGCNRALAHVNDSIVRLELLIEYLDHHPMVITKAPKL